VGFTQPGGYVAGDYELRLFIANQLAQSGRFTIEKRQVGAPFFDPIRFAEGIQNNEPVNVHPNQKFTVGVKEVYAFFDAGNLTDGLAIKGEWYRMARSILRLSVHPGVGARRFTLWSGISDKDNQPLVPRSTTQTVHQRSTGAVGHACN